jgi:AbrB family looped-hinge helix DNA binding protein
MWRRRESKEVDRKGDCCNTPTGITYNFLAGGTSVRVTIKGQVTIPQHIREKLGIKPSSEVDFFEDDGRVYLVKKRGRAPERSPFKKFRGSATVKMTTEEILALTRG